ncbi:transglycosylase family protein [Janibacter terrae]|uniref:Transglycosylase family protein n=2 Tax=Intrasporangiaceae TaxID=85021 RepID=A0ABZ2FIF4_9MICO|nr:transglycosylase family protein [Janibacter terrae]MBA4085040.1 transglycosylase-like protein [Kytococcus sp.]
MFYSPKHAPTVTTSPARRRIAGVAVAGATAAVGSVATAQSSSAATNANVWDAVAQCESGGNWSINTGNGFYGGLQFTSQTWQGFGGGKYASNAHQATKAQQIEIAQEVLKVQGPGAWPVCSQKAGLTKANGMVGGGSTAPAPTQARQQAPEQASRSEVRAPATAGALVVDGIRGPKTNAAIEKWVGTAQDGTLSSADVQALQAKVGTGQDGVIGPKTTSALQQVVGADVDGIWGPQTTSKLQAYLNAN